MFAFSWKFKYFLLCTSLWKWWKLYLNYRSKSIFKNCLRTKSTRFSIQISAFLWYLNQGCSLPRPTTTPVRVGGISTLETCIHHCWALSSLSPRAPHNGAQRTKLLKQRNSPHPLTSLLRILLRSGELLLSHSHSWNLRQGILIQASEENTILLQALCPHPHRPLLPSSPFSSSLEHPSERSLVLSAPSTSVQMVFPGVGEQEWKWEHIKINNSLSLPNWTDLIRNIREKFKDRGTLKSCGVYDKKAKKKTPVDTRNAVLVFLKKKSNRVGEVVE